MVDLNKWKDYDYEQHQVNIDIAETLITIQQVLDAHNKMIQLVAKFVGMTIPEIEEE